MNPIPALIIFIKNPQKGQVKTRLARTVGEEKALQIYEALLAHTRQIALQVPCKRYLFYSQYIDQTDDWSVDDFHKKLQVEGGLGYKMKTAFQDILQHHDKAIIVGSDCASLTPHIIQTGFEQLETHPFVIGPAMDGGYYLLGMNQYQPSIFEDINWSTSTVFNKTIEKIESLNVTHFSLPTLSDIDNEDDWKKYGWEV